jgi:hypothetical protein
MFQIRLISLMIFVALTGCATRGSKIYPNTLDKNLVIKLNLGNTASKPSTIDVYMGVNNIAKDCTDIFEGELTLAPGVNKIGLAPGKRVYLVVVATDRGDFLGRNKGYSVKQGALFIPEPGKRYEIVINYIDEMWDYRLHEINGNRRQSLPVVPISVCKPS